jgi:hypothetical protein
MFFCMPPQIYLRGGRCRHQARPRHLSERGAAGPAPGTERDRSGLLRDRSRIPVERCEGIRKRAVESLDLRSDRMRKRRGPPTASPGPSERPTQGGRAQDTPGQAPDEHTFEPPEQRQCGNDQHADPAFQRPAVRARQELPDRRPPKQYRQDSFLAPAPCWGEAAERWGAVNRVGGFGTWRYLVATDPPALT